MTAHARDGRDSPFGQWLRSQSDLDSVSKGLYACDIDFTFLKYRQRDDMGLNSRFVKMMLDVEIKSFSRLPSPQQKEALYFRHQLLKRQKRLFSSFLNATVSVWHFGQFVLAMDNDSPNTSTSMAWYWFGEKGNVSHSVVNVDQLKSILRFDVHPHGNFHPISTRRHHLTLKYELVDNSGLFPVARIVTHRS